MDRFVLFNHIGSENHGCEALVRTMSGLLEGSCVLLSENPGQDAAYGVDHVVQVRRACARVPRWSPEFLRAYAALKLRREHAPMDAVSFFKPIRALEPGSIGVSIGGDVYCYGDHRKYILIHQQMRKYTKKTILAGCSLEPKLLEDPAMVAELRSFDCITARESITYEAMRSAGIPNVQLMPDSAFTLPVHYRGGEGHDAFLRNAVGLNLSPLVERRSDAVFENCLELIRWILGETTWNVALIPHVVWRGNDDREVLERLRRAAGETERVRLLPDGNCMELKGDIARCRFFVGARTHATIAAYSGCVPTLAVGYSVKARGIARDIFGTENGCFIPCQELKQPGDLTAAFQRIVSREGELRAHLEQRMPGYIARVRYDSILADLGQRRCEP